MGGGCWQSGREEERRRAAAGGETRAEEKLERCAGSSGLRCALAPLRRSVRGDSRADVRFAVEAAAPGAAALGRPAVGVDAVCGAGGARHPGATGPHPGGGEASPRSSRPHVEHMADWATNDKDRDAPFNVGSRNRIRLELI